MKYLFLVSALVMFSIYSMEAQTERKVEKEVIIIKKDSNDDDIKKRVIKKRINSENMSDDQVDSLIQSILKNDAGIEDIDIDIKNIDGASNRKIVIKTIKDGQENTITRNIEGNEKRRPKVKLGVMLMGTTVDDIIKDSVADKGGVLKGDKIHKLDQQIIYSYNGLMEHLASYKLGDSAKLTVKRGEKMQTLKLVF